MIRATFNQDRGIYGTALQKGWKTSEQSPFVIFKGDKLWTIGHAPSRLSVDSMIPVGWPRTKAGVAELVKRIEAALPEEVAVMATCTGSGFSASQSEAVRRVKQFAMSQAYDE